MTLVGVILYLYLLTYTFWLHRRVRRLEKQPDPKHEPCEGALCRDGFLPNGDTCGLCYPCDARWGRPPTRPPIPSRPAAPPGPKPMGLRSD